MTITPQQSRMARAALELTIRELARQTGMPPSAVSRFESGQALTSERILRIRGALEQGGVTFLPEEATEGPGIRLSKGFERSVIVDRDGKHIAGIVGPVVRDIADDRAVAMIQDGMIYSLAGDPLGPLRSADMFRHTGSLPGPALDRLTESPHPSAADTLRPARLDLLLDDIHSSDSPA